jgi:hypothetical protein
MVPIVKAIYDAIGTENPKVFILLVTLMFTLFGFVLAVVVNRGYQKSVEKEHAAILAKTRAQEFPASRPQLRIARWGHVDPAKAARGAHTIQQGFYLANFGLGEAAVGVQVSLVVPTEVPDEWTSGGSSSNAIIVGKDDGEIFVPIWRKIGGFGPQGVLARFDLPSFLINVYSGQFGNKEIPVTIKYSSNGENYVTTQNLIFSPEQRYISGFGVPEQRLDKEAR